MSIIDKERKDLKNKLEIVDLDNFGEAENKIKELEQLMKDIESKDEMSKTSERIKNEKNKFTF